MVIEIDNPSSDVVVSLLSLIVIEVEMGDEAS
jgi:hypothetical protein